MNKKNNCCKELHKELGCLPECISIGTVAEEKCKKFRIESFDKNEVFCKVKVDNCCIISETTKKADFAFKRCKTGEFYIVELKGTDLDTAFKQVCVVAKFLNERKVDKRNIWGFIVATRVPKNDTRIGKFKEQFKKDVGRELKFQTNLCIHKV